MPFEDADVGPGSVSLTMCTGEIETVHVHNPAEEVEEGEAPHLSAVGIDPAPINDKALLMCGAGAESIPITDLGSNVSPLSSGIAAASPSSRGELAGYAYLYRANLSPSDCTSWDLEAGIIVEYVSNANRLEVLLDPTPYYLSLIHI